MGQAAPHVHGNIDPTERRRPTPGAGPGARGKIKAKIKTPDPRKIDVTGSGDAKEGRPENEMLQDHTIRGKPPGGVKSAEGRGPTRRPA